MATEELVTASNFYERSISACFGALFTSIVVTPLDVVKTRQQAFLPENSVRPGTSLAKCSKCGIYIFDNGLMEHCIPKTSRPFFRSPSKIPLEGTFRALATIAKSEGVSGLYKGLSPTLLMAVPSTVLYFSLFDEIRDQIKKHSMHDWIAPLFAGPLARLIAATSISPLELVRTQMQAENKSIQVSFLNYLTKVIEKKGFLSLWEGLGPTLWRDLPFSAIYWLTYEESKKGLNIMYHKEFNEPPHHFMRSYTIPFIGGAVSGLLAAFITTPFDVVKTQRQVYMYAPSLSDLNHNRNTNTFKLMKQIVEADGISGLFRGGAARLMKIVPACAIMISSYEFGKQMFHYHQK